MSLIWKTRLSGPRFPMYGAIDSKNNGLSHTEHKYKSQLTYKATMASYREGKRLVEATCQPGQGNNGDGTGGRMFH